MVKTIQQAQPIRACREFRKNKQRENTGKKKKGKPRKTKSLFNGTAVLAKEENAPGK